MQCPFCGRYVGKRTIPRNVEVMAINLTEVYLARLRALIHDAEPPDVKIKAALRMIRTMRRKRDGLVDWAPAVLTTKQTYEPVPDDTTPAALRRVLDPYARWLQDLGFDYVGSLAVMQRVHPVHVSVFANKELKSFGVLSARRTARPSGIVESHIETMFPDGRFLTTRGYSGLAVPDPPWENWRVFLGAGLDELVRAHAGRLDATRGDFDAPARPTLDNYVELANASSSRWADWALATPFFAMRMACTCRLD